MKLEGKRTFSKLFHSDWLTILFFIENSGLYDRMLSKLNNKIVS